MKRRGGIKNLANVDKEQQQQQEKHNEIIFDSDNSEKWNIEIHNILFGSRSSCSVIRCCMS